MGQESHGSVSGHFQHGDPFEGEVMVLSKATAIWRLDWDWRICCQDSFHLALPHGPPWRNAPLLEHGSYFPSERETGKPTASHNVCGDLALESHVIISAMSCWLHRPALFSLGGDYTKVVNTSRWGHRRVLEANCCTHYTSPTSLPWLMQFSPCGLPLPPLLILMW